VKLIFSEHAWEDYLHWQAQDRKVLARIDMLLKECTRTPFAGRGKPEPLTKNLVGSGRAASLRRTGLFTALLTMVC